MDPDYLGALFAALQEVGMTLHYVDGSTDVINPPTWAEEVVDDSKPVSLSSNPQVRVRVREAIPHLLDELTNEKVSLPPKMFTEKYDATPYPSSVTKTKSYSEFGLSMEYYILYSLYRSYGEKFVSAKRENLDGSVMTIADFFHMSSQDIEKYSSTFETASREVVAYFQCHYPPLKICRIECDCEISFNDGNTSAHARKVDNNLVGHPDLVIYLPSKEVVIFDVKVFARMTGGNTNRAIRAQLALYIALYRKNGYTCNKVGVIMPWGRNPTVVEYSVAKWSSTRLLEIALDCTEKVTREPAVRLRWSHLLSTYQVGFHVQKGDAMYYLSRRPDVPIQIFLYGNNPSPQTEAKGRLELEKANPSFHQYKAFVHAPYNLNLAKSDDYIVTAARNYMKDATRYGFKGVVFHCGHHPNAKDGVKQMKKNIAKILEVVDEGCPFLLETPCGNANELLSTPEEFDCFLSKYETNKIGGCLDTAHVFVSGYMPREYLGKMSIQGRNKICFFHFNGSRRRYCCHVDGHAHVTTVQNIPDEELVPILDFAKEWGISCVTE